MVLPTDNTKSTNFLLKQQKAQKNTKKINFVLSVLSVGKRKNFVIFVLSVGKRKIIR